jgi:hypothetical protein
MMGGMGMGFGVFGLVLMILFWGGLIVLGVWLVRVLFPSANRPPAVPSDPSIRFDQHLTNYITGIRAVEPPGCGATARLANALGLC